MFRLAKDPRFTHKVTVLVPVDGGHREETFQATFRVIPIEEAAEMAKTAGAEFFDRVLVECGDLADADGQPLEWNDAVREQLLALPYVSLALVKTYFAAVNRARAGN